MAHRITLAEVRAVLNRMKPAELALAKTSKGVFRKEVRVAVREPFEAFYNVLDEVRDRRGGTGAWARLVAVSRTLNKIEAEYRR